ncbi:hypothetical protein SAMN06264364_1017 [Quadrisphaera granulorum]|uniref:Uncharacterized protein n=1 Tax=Quadrisphaera granulorum TaxID=317664 RepID=A0A316AGI4_9ACTN|nr:hypothetical protein [Quadrisphaera granulorum]PWJ56034.1 hypothetical protein BXY45_1017 [Quadrisphaera granulorum]SZE94668.1 hypothetical protein SAMN06264364_1017 [Quadrisphaera granulorum]
METVLAVVAAWLVAGLVLGVLVGVVISRADRVESADLARAAAAAASVVDGPLPAVRPDLRLVPTQATPTHEVLHLALPPRP